MANVPVSFGPFLLDAERRRLSRDGATLELGDRAFDILVTLAAAQGRLVTKDELLTIVWPGLTVEENSIHVHVSALRKALGDDGDGEGHVVTVRGRGYRLNGLGAARAAAPGREEGRDGPRIAVLPFTSLSVDPEQDYFADGIVEEIITALTRMPSLCVIARNSSFAAKGMTADSRAAGEMLGARYTLTGSVRRTANRVRVTGQLIDTQSAMNIWADRFDGELEDIFDLQDQITERVVGAIAPRLELAEIERSSRKPSESLAAYDYYLRGLARLYRNSAEDSSEALNLFYEAIALDADFPSPYGAAVSCYMERRLSGWATDFEAEAAEVARLGARIATLGRDDAPTLASGAFGLAYVVGDLKASAPMAERALRLNPNLTTALFAAALVRMFEGKADESLDLLLRAMQLSPLDPHMPRFRTGAASAHLLAGRYEEARELASRVLAERPTYLPAHQIVAASCALSGREDEGREVLGRALRLDPGLSLATLRDRIGPYEAETFDRYARALSAVGLPG